MNSFWGGPEGFERVCERVGYIERGNAFDEDWLAKQYEFEARNAEAFVGMIGPCRTVSRAQDHSPAPSVRVFRVLG